ncbi:MAG: V-type ATPase subunit [Deltaproteobacteria bacterium]|nr:V-type ATPase subunit [Deltaproteobacteria bacterium]
MARYLGDINTRARGLRTHLLPASDLERLARATSLFVLQRELSGLGYARSDAPATAMSLEKEIRRHAAGQITILERWCTDDRRTILAVIFEDEDRRSIQAILRGAQQGTATEARMAGLVPTRSLPERALLTLAGQPTPTDVIRMLALWSHPLATSLAAAASGPHPSLFEIEIELQRAFARRASARAHLGGSQLVEYVKQVVDVMNTWSALLHFVERDPSIVDMTFVDGGRWLTRDVFHKLMSLETRPQLEKRLAWELRKSALGSAFRHDIEDLAQLESAMLHAQIDWQNRAVRIDPSGAAPIIGFAIELRAEVLNLRRIIWGVALRAPAALIQADMVVA